MLVVGVLAVGALGFFPYFSYRKDSESFGLSWLPPPFPAPSAAGSRKDQSLMNLKTMNGWIDKSFIELLQLLKDMLPEGNTLPNRNYEAKKNTLSNGYGV